MLKKKKKKSNILLPFTVKTHLHHKQWNWAKGGHIMGWSPDWMSLCGVNRQCISQIRLHRILKDSYVCQGKPVHSLSKYWTEEQ